VLRHTDLEQLRIDLDRVDVARALLLRDRHVRAGAGANDEHVVVRPAGEPVVDLVIERLEANFAERVECLMRDAVDSDVGQAALDLELVDSVVGRPDVRRVGKSLLEDEHENGGEREDVSDGEERQPAT